MQEAMNDADFTHLVWTGLAVLAFYGLGLGLIVAIIASFVTIHFIRHKSYAKNYLIFSLSMGGAVTGLLLTLPFEIALLHCANISHMCGSSWDRVLRLSSQAIIVAPPLGAIVGVVVGYWKVFTKHR
ncbi:MAG: hypothetical protein KME42_04270 [Tildeniella nuda ZEHNDER 1965/U140]|jgi:predicted alpha/beta hydrolase|nr:hypothetical protein [Tildeniella nuda ZEHNDER 1965/U140]